MFATFSMPHSPSRDDPQPRALTGWEKEAARAVLGRNEPIPLDVAVGLMGEGLEVEPYEEWLEGLKDGESA